MGRRERGVVIDHGGRMGMLEAELLIVVGEHNRQVIKMIGG